MNENVKKLIESIIGKYFCFDIDGILCLSTEKNSDGELDYTKSIPLFNNIRIVNALCEHNHVTLFSARGKRTGKIDWFDFTVAQLKEWGVKYNLLRMDKPHYDLFVDDKAVTNFDQMFNSLKST